MKDLKFTINSIIEAVQFLLQHEVSYVLTEYFCQDPLENYFGHQRSLGARKDNPSSRDFRCNNNAIKNQKIFRPIAGNIRGGHDQNNTELSCESKKKLKRTKHKPESANFSSAVSLSSTHACCYKNDNFILTL